MKKLFFLVFTLFSAEIIFAAEAANNSIWMKIVDQDKKPIVKASVFYCVENDYCVLDNYKRHRRQAFTNNDGYAKLVFSNNGYLIIQGVKKEGYDIRLSTLPFSEVKLNQGNNIGKIENGNYFGGITLGYGKGVEPYSLPVLSPIFELEGWRFGQSTCLEQDHKFIYHDGRSESKWNIENEEHYYKVGDGTRRLEKSDANDYDFKITINRKYYPWGNQINRYSSRYRLEVEFESGGIQGFEKTGYLHAAPSNSYKRKISIKYSGLGEVNRAYTRTYYFKVGSRYGAINFHIIPSRYVMFEYFLNRKANQELLNIKPFVGDYGKPSNYFTCPGRATSLMAKTTQPGECAKPVLEYSGC